LVVKIHLFRFVFEVFFNWWQRSVYESVWHFEEQTCQTATNFIKYNSLKISTIRQMFYIHCCMLGFVHYQLVINLLQSKIRSFEALLFPKKIVFRVGKKAGANRQALLQFLDCGSACANCKCA